MSFPKLLVIASLLLFSGIGIAALCKKKPPASEQYIAIADKTSKVVEVPLHEPSNELPFKANAAVEAISTPTSIAPKQLAAKIGPSPLPADGLPDADEIERLFRPGSNALPIVETITYTSRVPWVQGRPAWLVDYASHYSTSRHFIARSLNRGPDYLTQNVSNGDRFNVFREGKNFNFYLLVDLIHSKLWFYYIDLDTQERKLLKRYDVVLGRVDPNRASGLLTPLGKFSIGNKVAIYRPNVTGLYQNKKTEMVRVFGSRWIPFDQEIAGCTEPAKGLGLHGAPWMEDPVTGELKECTNSMGKYDSDGCIRLLTKDIEELFSIIITKPTIIEIVRDFSEAKLPGKEIALK